MGWGPEVWVVTQTVDISLWCIALGIQNDTTSSWEPSVFNQDFLDPLMNSTSTPVSNTKDYLLLQLLSSDVFLNIVK